MSRIEQKPAAMRESRDIEWMVNWAVEKQRAHIGGFGGEGHYGPAELKSQLANLGMKVDGGRHKRERAVTHSDADVVWGCLLAMISDQRTGEAAAMVFNHGRLGTQPDWGHAGCGHHVLQRRNNGRGKAIKRYADQRGGHGLIGFEWKFVGHTLEQLELMMIGWSAWHAALRELRELINPQMSTYRATGPVWMAEPWNDPVYIGASITGQLDELEDVD